MGNNTHHIGLHHTCEKYGISFILCLNNIDIVNMAKLDVYFSEVDVGKWSQILDLIDIWDKDISDDFFNKCDVSFTIQMLTKELGFMDFCP